MPLLLYLLLYVIPIFVVQKRGISRFDRRLICDIIFNRTGNNCSDVPCVRRIGLIRSILRNIHWYYECEFQ